MQKLQVVASFPARTLLRFAHGLRRLRRRFFAESTRGASDGVLRGRRFLGGTASTRAFHHGTVVMTTSGLCGQEVLSTRALPLDDAGVAGFSTFCAPHRRKAPVTRGWGSPCACFARCSRRATDSSDSAPSGSTGGSHRPLLVGNRPMGVPVVGGCGPPRAGSEKRNCWLGIRARESIFSAKRPCFFFIVA